MHHRSSQSREEKDKGGSEEQERGGARGRGEQCGRERAHFLLQPDGRPSQDSPSKKAPANSTGVRAQRRTSETEIDGAGGRKQEWGQEKVLAERAVIVPVGSM